MKVLMIGKGFSNSELGVSSFISELAVALRDLGIEVDVFPISKNGLKGYLESIFKLNKLLRKKKYDIVHGHYLLSGIVSILQFRALPVVTLIGCDINIQRLRFLAKMTVFKRAKAIIFVTEKLQIIAGYKKESYVVQYGVDLRKFFPVEKITSREQLGWKDSGYNILFSSSFERIEKNSKLAFKAIEILNSRGIKCTLIEFKNIPAEKLNHYYNASDLLLLTSIREGSPQCLKEAMACNLPAVLTDVGDVKEVTSSLEGYIITSFDAFEIADAIENVFLKVKMRTKGRDRIVNLKFDIESKAIETLGIYKRLTNEN
jgi:teichuronic acid biosynthesis glycosyltransferase TuaC